MTTMISDSFLVNCQGGAELVDDAICDRLGIKNKLYSNDPNANLNIDGTIILTNFYNIHATLYNDLVNKKFKYIIIEHDYKFFPSRNPFTYKDSICPKMDRQFLSLYKNAEAVFVQTEDQYNVFKQNEIEGNIISLDCSIWSTKELDFLSSIKTVNPVNRKFAVIQSTNPIKGTNAAIQFCDKNSLDYELIPSMPHKEFLGKLNEYSGLVFFPMARESCCRLVVEARCLGMNVITSKNYGASNASWFKFEPNKLWNYLDQQSEYNFYNIHKYL